MDRAHVLEDEISIRVEELLIIGAVEGVAIVADSIQFSQLEADARRSGRDTAGCPSHVEELDAPISYLFPGPHAHPI